MKRSVLLFIGANLTGLCLYTHFVRAIQHTIQAEGRDYSDFGDSLEFITTGLPVLAVCLLLNIVWGVMGLRDAAQFRGYRSIISCAIIAVFWIGDFFVLRRLP